jgi:hypothetical protein
VRAHVDDLHSFRWALDEFDGTALLVDVSSREGEDTLVKGSPVM